MNICTQPHLLESPDSVTRPPLVVVAPKTSPAYQTHSYPTKIPPEAIVPFIEAVTQPGAVVLDPFCGSGMTGVAALQSGRSAILSDLSPGAVHLASGHTRFLDPRVLARELHRLDEDWMRLAEQHIYSAQCPTCGAAGLMRHTLWSDVLACPACSADIVLWDQAATDGQIPRQVKCPHCGHLAQRAGVPARTIVPVKASVSCSGGCRTLQDVDITSATRETIASTRTSYRPKWVPSHQISSNREMYKRCALHLRKIETVADFYLERPKYALSHLWDRINRCEPEELRDALRFAFTNTAWHSSRMRRFNSRGGQRPLTGTLYVPQLVAEPNVFEVFRHQVVQLGRFYSTLPMVRDCACDVRQSSATNLGWVEDQTVDYVFTDPPFGSNIFYGDCNIVWESWLGSITDTTEEIVVNRSKTPDTGGKTVQDYERLLGDAFAEIRRVLTPNGCASVVFHNSDDRVWGALLSAAERSGLVQTDVSLLDKVQRSMKGYKGRDGSELVPFYDLVITFAPGNLKRQKLNGAGEIAAESVKAHLTNLDRLAEPVASPLRSVEYLYSLAVSSIVRVGASPEGLSFRAFEALCRDRFAAPGRYFTLN